MSVLRTKFFFLLRTAVQVEVVFSVSGGCYENEGHAWVEVISGQCYERGGGR